MGAAAATGTGGLIGAGLSRLLDRHHAEYLQEQLTRGGLLLWVRTQDEAHESRATVILERHSADDVHIHDLPAAEFAFTGGVSQDTSFMKRLGL